MNAARPGCDSDPFPFRSSRAHCPALPRPAAAASAASQDRAAPAAPAVFFPLAAGIKAPPSNPFRSPDWADRSRGSTPPSTLKGTTLGEY